MSEWFIGMRRETSSEHSSAFLRSVVLGALTRAERVACNIYRTFVTLVERAGLPKQRFHDQRRCFATLQLADGVPIHTVMKRLGHTQISTTLDIYGHVTRVMQREAAERMGVCSDRSSTVLLHRLL